jgi:hypothetical protein
MGPAVAAWRMGQLWTEPGFHADDGFVLLAVLLSHHCEISSSGDSTARVHVFIFQAVTGTYVTMLFASWICASLLKMVVCSCREIVSSPA